MPLDPSIANPTPVKINDPMEQYGNYLKTAYLDSEIAKAKEAEADKNALRALYKNNDSSDRNAFRRAAAQSNLGDLIPTMNKQWADLDKTAAETGKMQMDSAKANADALGKMLENEKQRLVGISPKPEVGFQQYVDHIIEAAKDPLMQQLAPGHNWQSDLQEAHQAAVDGRWAEFLTAKASSLENALKKHIISVNNGGYTDEVATPEFSFGTPTAAVVPGSKQAVTASPNKPVTNITVHAEQKGVDSFMDTVGKGLGGQYINLATAAQSAPQNIQQIDKMIDLLNDGAIVGALSDPKVNVARVAKAFGFNVDDKQLIHSQELRKMLAQNVYNQVGQLRSAGVPLSRLTNMELQLIQQGAPSANMDAGTIKELLMAQRKMTQNAIKMYNNRNSELLKTPQLSGAIRALASNKVPEIPDRVYPSDNGSSGLSPAGQAYQQKYGF